MLYFLLVFEITALQLKLIFHFTKCWKIDVHILSFLVFSLQSSQLIPTEGPLLLANLPARFLWCTLACLFSMSQAHRRQTTEIQLQQECTSTSSTQLSLFPCTKWPNIWGRCSEGALQGPSQPLIELICIKAVPSSSYIHF